MVDLTSEMAALWAALGPAPGHRGRVVQIAAANSGEGVSTVAREYARLTAVRDLHVPHDRLRDTAGRILGESGQALRRLLAGLAMPDWPEGARRAISFTLAPVQFAADMLAQRTSEDLDAVLATLREGAGLAYDNEGD